MKTEQLHELLYQSLETEQGGIQVYETAVALAQNADLKKEWKEYLEQTRNHEQILLGVFKELDLDPRIETPGRTVVRHLGQSLVDAIVISLRYRCREKCGVPVEKNPGEPWRGHFAKALLLE